MDKFFNLIPETLPAKHRKSQKDFSRNRCLAFDKLVAYILHLVSSGSSAKVDIKSGQFFKNMRRYGLWHEAQAVHRSSISKGRSKISWEFFKDLMHDAVQLAYEAIPPRTKYLWHNMNVYAIDGSRYILPATPNIKETFDSDSGLANNGKGHYPECLVSTLFDVFRRLPVARTVVDSKGSERDEAVKLLKCLPKNNNLILFDRGYPSFELVYRLTSDLINKFIIRCPATSSFKAIKNFLKEEKQESIIDINPTSNFLSGLPCKNRKKVKPIKLRAIKMVSPSDGTVSVLLTNLYGAKYSHQEITDLYFKRWEVEVYYRDEKTIQDVTQFHSKTVNGVLQELYAVAIVNVIARTLAYISSKSILQEKHVPQFKNAVFALSADIGFLASDDPEKAACILEELLQEIARVIYYKPKVKRPSAARVNKSPNNKWKHKKRLKCKH